MTSLPMPAWGLMWTIAGAIYGGCKWLTYRDARERLATIDRLRAIGYLFAWPGMNASAFLSGEHRVPRPPRIEWIAAILKTGFGAGLTWGAARIAAAEHPLVAGWIGMTGLIFVMHFGAFHLLSLAWRQMGIEALPIMRNPLRATSLGEFWGRRWNMAFHELVTRFTFRPLRPLIGVTGAMLLVFLVSGAVHELVISIPARGGYGLPTGYFALQGAGLAIERTPFGRRLGLGRGWRGWLFTLLVTAAPAFWLFPRPFVLNVILPMLAAIGAI